KEAVLARLAFSEPAGESARQELIAVESMRRLKNLDLRKHPEHAAALERMLERNRGTPTFVEVVGQFGLEKHYPDLLAIAQKNPDQQIGVTAIRTLLEKRHGTLVAKALQDKDEKQVLA